MSEMTAEERLIEFVRDMPVGAAGTASGDGLWLEFLEYIDAALAEAEQAAMEKAIAAVANAPVSYKSAAACVAAIRRAFAEEQKP